MNIVKKGSADVTRYVNLVDSAAGTPETAYTITSLDLQYTRTRTAPAAKVDAVALAATDTAHTDNRAIEIDAVSSPGLYRIDWPDAAFATGADKVILVVSGTGLHPAVEEIQLVNFDPEDVVRLGLTALPAAAPDAAGGLPISDAGGLDLDAKIGALTYGTANRVNAQVFGMEANVMTAAAAAVDLTTELQNGLATAAAQSTAQNDLDLLTGADGATLAASQPNYAPAKAGDAMALTSGERTTLAAAIWNALTSGMSTVGSIGKLLVDNINATISSRSSHAATDIVSNGAITTTGGAVSTVTTTTTATNLTNAPTNGDLTAAMKASVNAEVLDVLNTDTFAEPGQGTPAATASLVAKLGYLYKNFRNRKTQTSTVWSLYNDDAVTVDQKATVADDATTASKTEIATGP